MGQFVTRGYCSGQHMGFIVLIRASHKSFLCLQYARRRLLARLLWGSCGAARRNSPKEVWRAVGHESSLIFSKGGESEPLTASTARFIYKMQQKREGQEYLTASNIPVLHVFAGEKVFFYGFSKLGMTHEKSLASSWQTSLV